MSTRFNVCDLNAIETRVGAWLAGWSVIASAQDSASLAKYFPDSIVAYAELRRPRETVEVIRDHPLAAMLREVKGVVSAGHSVTEGGKRPLSYASSDGLVGCYLPTVPHPIEVLMSRLVRVLLLASAAIVGWFATQAAVPQTFISPLSVTPVA